MYAELHTKPLDKSLKKVSDQRRLTVAYTELVRIKLFSFFLFRVFEPYFYFKLNFY